VLKAASDASKICYFILGKNRTVETPAAEEPHATAVSASRASSAKSLWPAGVSPLKRHDRGVPRSEAGRQPFAFANPRICKRTDTSTPLDKNGGDRYDGSERNFMGLSVRKVEGARPAPLISAHASDVKHKKKLGNKKRLLLLWVVPESRSA
jgi:hypothetical protein